MAGSERPGPQQPDAEDPTVQPLRLRRVGEAALLAEFPDAAAVLAAYSRLRAHPAAAPALDGIVDVVPAERTVLVTYDPARVSASGVERWVRAASDRTSAPRPAGVAPRNEPAGARTLVEIPVHYDGIDLHEAGEALGMSAAELVLAHTSAPWTAAFIGFAPGFAYLTSGDDRFTLPRRAVPRARVPAGSVALAAGYCGIYPRESPGGWHLIGRTDADLWNLDRAHPALIAPGTHVRFVDAA
ncbi:5-oxoprolinase subunit B family protein [Herbiconiux liangxiaofengii]|uniref:5-oxoprolinase subunit B family protein n=1 Tax=Herbiconiux liangxiaofengii TaxID=3342795 RepID=UPI0035B8ADB4